MCVCFTVVVNVQVLTVSTADAGGAAALVFGVLKCDAVPPSPDSTRSRDTSRIVIATLYVVAEVRIAHVIVAPARTALGRRLANVIFVNRLTTSVST